MFFESQKRILSLSVKSRQNAHHLFHFEVYAYSYNSQKKLDKLLIFSASPIY